MSRLIYYSAAHNLLYLFTGSRELRLDVDTIRDVQAKKSTLLFIIYTIRYESIGVEDSTGEYAVMNESSEVCTYARCSHEMFIEWYENQPLLDIFVRANGIRTDLCKRLLAPSAPPAPAATRLQTKPHLVALVLRDAIAEKKICAISLDPITQDSVCIAPCYHCFSKEAIDAWLLTNSTCPECRERCV